MNKSKLIEAVSARTRLPKARTVEMVDVLLEAITLRLVRKEKVVLSGFGTFRVKKAGEKVGRNPQTGERMVHPAHWQVGFVVSKVLKKAVS